MESIEIKARNYDEALVLAQEKTGRPLDELNFECIKEPLLFFKGIYRVTIEEDVSKKEKQNKKDSKKKDNNNNSNSNNNKQTAKTDNVNEKRNSENNSTKNNRNNNNKTNNKNTNNVNSETNSDANQKKKQNKENEENRQNRNNTNEHNKKPQNNKKECEEVVKTTTEKEKVDEKKAEEPTIEVIEAINIVTDSEQEENPTKNNEVSPAELDHFIRKFIVEFAKAQGVEAEVESQIRDGNKYYILLGNDVHKLIGYHGENLNAMQIIIGAVVNEKYSTSTRILIDIENYKVKREENLKSLARRTARKVISTRRSQKLEPMTANERRIIHSELQSNQKVTTESHGTEPNRYVVIKLQ